MKKFLSILLAAVLFGAVAGGTMVGVQKLAGASQYTVQRQAELPAAEETQAAETEAQTEAETAPAETAAPAETKAAATAPASGSEAQKETKASAPAQTQAAAVLDVSGIVEEAMPQLVSITNTMVIKQSGYGSLFDYFYGIDSGREYEVPASGSGVILDKTEDELLIVTNNHVIEDSKELSVTFIDGTSVDAAVKGADNVVDLAVIAVPLADIPEETMNQIKIATLHDQDDLKVGQGVIAIGNALGFGQTVTVGYISALDREIQAENSVYSDLIQIDAAINPGNSGGALLNMNGEVIGINVAKLSQTSVEGVGYSIPVAKAMDVIENLSNAKTRVEVEEDKQGRVGIYMNTVSPANAKAFGIPAGVIITGFSDEEIEGYGPEYVQPSPAKEAGLLKNDIITKFEGQNIRTAEELANLMHYYEAGSEVEITVQRLVDGTYEEKTFTVKLGNKIDESIAQDGGKSGRGQKSEQGKGGKGKPEEKAGSDAADNAEAGQDNAGGEGAEGQENQDGSTDGFDSYSDIYDLFRYFLEQYR